MAADPNTDIARTARRLILAATLVLLPVAAFAEEPNPTHLYDKFQFEVSGTAVGFNSELRVDANQGDDGTDIDAEDDLKAPEIKVQPRFELRWRPGRRHELELGYQFARRNSEHQLDNSFDFGDTTFMSGTHVRSHFDTDRAFLNYRYAFMAREKTQVGLTFGVGALFIDTQVDALTEIQSEDGEREVEYGAGGSIIGPSAAIGPFANFQVGEDWYIHSDLRWLKATVDRFTVRVLDAEAGTRWYPWTSVGFDLSGAVSSIALDVARPEDRDGLAGSFEYSLLQLRLGLVYVP
ncbi:MAG TPA: hypothetical protein VF720_05960 [Candidatus Eisenbacteria bacterium]